MDTFPSLSILKIPFGIENNFDDPLKKNVFIFKNPFLSYILLVNVKGTLLNENYSLLKYLVVFFIKMFIKQNSDNNNNLGKVTLFLTFC